MSKVIKFIPKKEVERRKPRSSIVSASFVDDIEAHITRSLLNEADAQELIRPQKVISVPKLKIISIKNTPVIYENLVIGMIVKHLFILIHLSFYKPKNRTKAKLKIVKTRQDL